MQSPNQGGESRLRTRKVKFFGGVEGEVGNLYRIPFWLLSDALYLGVPYVGSQLGIYYFTYLTW